MKHAGFPHAPARPRRLAAALLLSALAGCATRSAPSAAGNGPPPVPASAPAFALASPQAITLQGQLSVKVVAWGDQPGRGVSVGYFLEGNAQAGRIDLMTPLGSQVARVTWQDTGVWLDDGRETRQFDSLASLSEVLFGERLPLQALPWWMQGQPDPQQDHEDRSDGNGFQQAGWHIDTRAQAEGRITAERPGHGSVRPVVIRILADR